MRGGLLVGRLVLIVGMLLSTTAAATPNFDEGLRFYKSRAYAEAALSFYDVLAHDSDPERRDQAQIYLAEALKSQNLFLPALFYYQDLFANGGTQNRFYLNATLGLLELQERLHDPVLVPLILDAHFDAASFGRLTPVRIAQVNYLIGELSFRRNRDDEAKSFLEFVNQGPWRTKARYLLGVLALRRGDQAGAYREFDALTRDVGTAGPDPERSSLRNLARLAAGRAAYGLGRYGDAVAHYDSVPRMSHEWFNALCESAWAYFRLEEYGRALGQAESVTSPYFEKRLRPEAYVVQATTYFVNCQWDRVRRAVERYKALYEPMALALKAYLAAERAPVEYYRDVVAGGSGRLAVEIAREVGQSTRFHDFDFVLRHLDWEEEQVAGMKVWQQTELGEALVAILSQEREQLQPVVGAWVKRRLALQSEMLTHLQNQIDVLDFEVADAERRWLEQGREIDPGRRARLPRPNIPNDQWQHWSFGKEFWRDELGYIQHSIRSECN